MSDMDERIERAAIAFGFEGPFARGDYAWTQCERVIRAAFPELFDGTAWMAPFDPTEMMDGAGREWATFPNEGELYR